MTIWFDMDGTISDLYAVENWLPMLRAENPKPYAQARPLGNMQTLARKLNKLHRAGYTIGVISWGSKESSKAYLEAVREAKEKWLDKHLHSVKWDAIHVVEYGTPKENFKLGAEDILFDDEERNRENWGEYSFDPSQMMEILSALGRG